MQRILFSTTLVLLGLVAVSETAAQWGPCPRARRCYGSPYVVYEPQVIYYHGPCYPCYTAPPRVVRDVCDPCSSCTPVGERFTKQPVGPSQSRPPLVQPPLVQPHRATKPPLVKSPVAPSMEAVEKRTIIPNAVATGTKDIESTLAASGRFKKLLEAAKAAKVLEELRKGGPFTVFAPTDMAFERLGSDAFEPLMKDSKKLNSLLWYHGVRGRVPIDEAVKRGKVKTVLDFDLVIRRVDDETFVNTTRVVESDVNCSNGIIHVIDQVLLPPGFKLPEVNSSPKVEAGAREVTPSPPVPEPPRQTPR